MSSGVSVADRQPTTPVHAHAPEASMNRRERSRILLLPSSGRVRPRVPAALYCPEALGVLYGLGLAVKYATSCECCEVGPEGGWP